MGVVLGFVVGYVMGTRAGERGYEELVGTVRQIVGSGELKELLSSGLALLGEAVRAGTRVAADREVPAIRRAA